MSWYEKILWKEARKPIVWHANCVYSFGIFLAQLQQYQQKKRTQVSAPSSPRDWQEGVPQEPPHLSMLMQWVLPPYVIQALEALGVRYECLYVQMEMKWW